MASTSVPHQWKYDVFVSFRGEDICKSFIDHLLKDFRQKGIRPFRDDYDLPRGEVISPELYKAIEESRFLLVIFSKNYASSSWCLRELLKILECKQIKDHKHEVRIIFYDVKPTVVRKQIERYAKTFVEHKSTNRTEATKWREALSMAADLSGWDLLDMTNGYESKFIDNVSKEILQSLHHGPLHVGENLVGVYARVNKLNLLDFVGSNKVHIIGICGIGGIGKTTLTKAIYNMLYVHFEECSFYEDVQGTAKRYGLAQVQMQVIDDIMKTRATRVSNVSQGVMAIKRTIASKRILLVLDNVEHLEQIDALAGSPCWFFPGSMIILTCKDKQLLSFYKRDEVDAIYDMRYLGDAEALELFSLHAFGEKYPTKDFKELADRVVQYVQGHPLALKVLGHFLSNKTMSEWKSELGKLHVHPNVDIQRVLRVSFDGLDFNQKRIFLDIAYAFVGEDKHIIKSVLDSSRGYADTDIRVLVDKFLITISNYGKLQMHDLIQRMAMEIVCEESNMPGKRSRLWIESKVLKEIEVTEAVEVLVLVLKKAGEDVLIDGKDFVLMKNLRILKIYDPEVLPLKGFKENNAGTLEFLSNKLSLFCWHGFPFKFLPMDFYPKNIVAIDLSCGHIKKLWTKAKCFTRLKVMNLRNCRNLTSTPEFTEITNLEKLYLDDCVNLVKVHPSIKMLKRLVVLSMRNCSRVKSFRCIFEIESIQVMDLSGCSKVDHVDVTKSTKPPSFVSSRKWTMLGKVQHPHHLVIPSLAGVCFLQELDFSHCNILQVPDSIGGLSCLERLYLKGNNFISLPGSLSRLTLLRRLEVDGCNKLEVLPETPHGVFYVSANDCTSLQEVETPIVEKHDYWDITYLLRGCPKLFRNIKVRINSHGCRNMASIGISDLLKACICKRITRYDLGYKEVSMVFYGSSGGIPEWFKNQSKGDDDVKVDLPQSCKLKGYETWVVFTPNREKLITYVVKNADGSSLQTIKIYDPISFSGLNYDTITWLHYANNTCGLEEAKDFVTFSFLKNEGYEVKEWGVRLIYEEKEEEEEEEEDIDMNFLTSMMEELPIHCVNIWMKMDPTSLTTSPNKYTKENTARIFVEW